MIAALMLLKGGEGGSALRSFPIPIVEKRCVFQGHTTTFTA